MIRVRDEEMLDFMTKKLEDRLIEGAFRNETVDVTGLRAVGKTTALMNVAKRFKLWVVTHDRKMAHHYRIEFGYDNVFGTQDFTSGIPKSIPLIVDCTVNADVLTSRGFTVTTGFQDLNNMHSH